MSKKNKKFKRNMSDKTEEKRAQQQAVEETIETTATDAATDSPENELDETDKLQAKLDELQAQLDKEKKEYLFLMAEFDNFRKRTIKEKSEIIKNGAENAMKDILPIIDDFERAQQAVEESTDIDAVKEGISLIYNKFIKYLDQNGVKPIESNSKDFDTELHEAVTIFPASDESQKGKVIDTVQKGYTLNDKVLRHAKVVVGQ